MALGREVGVLNTGFALVNLGRTFALLEDLERAEATVTEGLDLARTVGSTHMMAITLTSLAQLKLRCRDYTVAAGLGAEALRLARALEYRWGTTHVVMIGAVISGHYGDVERAARLLAAVDSWNGRTGEVVSPMYHDPAVLLGPKIREKFPIHLGFYLKPAHKEMIEEINRKLHRGRSAIVR